MKVLNEEHSKDKSGVKLILNYFEERSSDMIILRTMIPEPFRIIGILPKGSKIQRNENCQKCWTKLKRWSEC